MKSLLSFLAAICLLVSSAHLFSQDGDDDQVKVIPSSPRMQDAVADALHGYAPKEQIQAGINQNAVYILSGTLFGDRRIDAVIDHDPLLVARWDANKWQLLQALSVTPEWKYPGWSSEESQSREPSADKPFWMEQLQGHPMLIVSTYVEKAGQHYITLLFNSDASAILDQDDSIPDAPKVSAGFLISTDCSRVKSESETTYFSVLEHDKFDPRYSCASISPWHAESDDELQYFVAESGSQEYLITDAGDDNTRTDRYLVFLGDFSPRYTTEIAPEKVSRPYVVISFQAREPSGPPPANLVRSEMEYMFEKLTGLPRRLAAFDGIGPDSEPHPKIETAARITVKGDRRLVRLLSPASAKKP